MTGAAEIAIILSASGGCVTANPEIAAHSTRLSIRMEHESGIEIARFDADIHGLAREGIAHFAWPLDAITPYRCRVQAQLFGGDALTGRGAADIDFTLQHISRDTVTCYLNRGGGGNPAVNALAASLGCPTAYAEDGYRPGVAMVWGVLRGSKDIVDEAIRRDAIFYYIDHAYFGRGHQKAYRITRNAFEAGPVRLCPADRIARLGVTLSPWHSGGRAIIVCPPTAYFMEAHDCPDWLDETIAELRRHSDRPIVLREKKGDEPLPPLAGALADAHALVTHSSNVAIEAAVLGTPVFVSETSAARPVGLSDLSLIESPVRPPRDQWLAHLAYSQFSYAEMQSGEAWDLLQAFEHIPFAS